MCPLSVRRGDSRALEDGGARGPSAPPRARGEVRWIAEAGRPAGRSGASRPLEAGGSGQAGLVPEARRGRALAASAPGGRRRCLDVETGYLDVETSEVARCRHQVSRCGNGSLHLETACPVRQTVRR